MLLLQAAPLLLLLGLLGSGRAGPVGACLVALAAAAVASAATLPDAAALPRVLAGEALRGAYLALAPIGVVLGGLLFHAAVAPETPAPRAATPARVFAVTLPMGAFLESVTGFAIGAVFALSALRGMGVGGALAGALAVQALVLVPWGGLGPGTALGAALAGVPAQAVATIAAWPNALWLPLLAPLLWRLSARAGVPVPARERLMQLALLGAMAALLLAAHAALPFEVAGILAAGPVAAIALWRADPPPTLAHALRAAAPYLLLTACLLLARTWPDPPAWRPFVALPAFPLSHVALVLLAVATAFLALQPHATPRALAAGRRALRPAIAMLLYVVLGRVLAGGGIAPALAQAAVDALGPAAPYAVAPMALLSGLITGSNVGSNAALMPVQAAIGLAAGLPPALVPGVHNFAGGAGAGLSVGVLALLCGLLADGTRPAALWRLLWPSLLAVVVLGTAAIGLLPALGLATP